MPTQSSLPDSTTFGIILLALYAVGTVASTIAIGIITYLNNRPRAHTSNTRQAAGPPPPPPPPLFLPLPPQPPPLLPGQQPLPPYPAPIDLHNLNQTISTIHAELRTMDGRTYQQLFSLRQRLRRIERRQLEQQERAREEERSGSRGRGRGSGRRGAISISVSSLNEGTDAVVACVAVVPAAFGAGRDAGEDGGGADGGGADGGPARAPEPDVGLGAWNAGGDDGDGDGAGGESGARGRSHGEHGVGQGGRDWSGDRIELVNGCAPSESSDECGGRASDGGGA